MGRAHTMTLALSVAALAATLTACTSDEDGVGAEPTPQLPSVSASPDGGSSTTPAAPTGTAEQGQGAMALDLAAVTLGVTDGTDPGAAAGRELEVPAGWEAEVWADVPGARLATWTPDERLLVSTGDRGDVVALTPADPGAAPAQEVLLDGLTNPQGLAFADDATLIVGEADAIRSYTYADGAATTPRSLIDGLPASGHGSKAVVVNGDRVVFSLGSESNRSPTDREGDPERAVLAAVPVAGGDMSVVATGVRNGFAPALAPDGSLWVAVNQADNQPYPFDDGSGRYGEVDPDYVNENPIEQLTRVDDGAELGWPYCVPDAREGVTDLPYVADPENNPDGDALDCASLAPTRVGLPSHSAPLGLTFTGGTAVDEALGEGAIVTTHGSWNRVPAREPTLMYLPWDGQAATLGAPVPLVHGFQDDAGERWGRTVATAIGPDGDLYVTDDQAGLVYRIGPAD